MNHFSNPHSTSTPTQTEILELYQLSYDFHWEAQSRQALEEYCQWYSIVAEQHRQEFQQLKQDVNLFRLFRKQKNL